MNANQNETGIESMADLRDALKFAEDASFALRDYPEAYRVAVRVESAARAHIEEAKRRP